ncbi:hypothetical protein DS2_07398 [Catenovulum agarivorans DS-2]|uniref:Uncharacterized protein n=1 Tax=Catenovulum agarivorans DS-2 TaxID=1328313 RepID=W7QCL7_9ALTE|nr:hypothetical protein [Catenovulum agarivorans]EWH10639.1 hypothetical protein DS2_07398 [Catenovulum agarivorans DS-2]
MAAYSKIYFCLKFVTALLASGLIAGCEQPPAEELALVQTDNGAFAADLSTAGVYSVISTQTGVQLWDVEKQLPTFAWQHQPNQPNLVHTVKISHNNKFVLTAEDQAFAVWNMQTGANKGYYRIEKSEIVTADISQTGQQVALGLMDGRVLFIELDTGRRLEFLGHTERISQLSMSANGQYILSGGYDGKALLWRSQNAQIVYDFAHTGRITQVALDHQARFAFTANSTNQSYIWDLTNGEKLSQLNYTARQQIFTSVKFSHNGLWLATGAPKQKIKIWSVKSGELLAQWPIKADNFAATVLDFAFNLQDDVLYANTSFGLVQAWSLQLFQQQ